MGRKGNFIGANKMEVFRKGTIKIPKKK